MKRLLSVLMLGLAIGATSQVNAQQNMALHVPDATSQPFRLGDIGGEGVDGGVPDGIVEWEADYHALWVAKFAQAQAGTISQEDLTILDFNKDGAFTFLDAGPIQDVLHFARGDVNRDCYVDFQDIIPFISVLADVSNPSSGVKYDPLADMNEDNEVDFLDIQGFTASLAGNPPSTIIERAFYNPVLGYPGVELRIALGLPDPYLNFDGENEMHECLIGGGQRSPESRIPVPLP